MLGKRRHSGQKKQWIDDIVQWGEKSLVEMVRHRRRTEKVIGA